MLSFAFWNTNKRQDPAVIAELAAGNGHPVDALLLAECAIPSARLLRQVNAGGPPILHLVWQQERLVLLTRFPRGFVTDVRAHARFTFCSLHLPAKQSFTLACAHLRDPHNNSEKSREAACHDFSYALRRYEEEVNHRRTVVVGDLNVDPYHPAMVAANGLHAVMSRTIAGQRSRTLDAQEWPYLYNAMWSRFGDDSKGPPGTHYFRRAEHVCYFWHMYDQVLVRPELLSCFADDDVQVVRALGARSLEGRPVGNPDRQYSDHFPLVFRLSL